MRGLSPSDRGVVIRRLLVGGLASFVALLMPGRSARAQSADSAAVVQAAETILRAISTRDTALARTVLLPGAQFVATAATAPGVAARPRVSTDREFYVSLPMGRERYLERMWAPVVTLHGDVATLAAPYDFHVDGTFSHCGVDVFALVRGATGWRISSITYTVQPRGCVPSPLGAPARQP